MISVLLGVAAAFAWGVHDLLARSLAPRLGPMRMGLWIMLLSGLMLTVIVATRGTLFAASSTDLLWGLGLGFAYACGAAGIYKAFSLGPISVVGPLTCIYPALVVLWGLFSGLAPTPIQWAAIAAALAGGVIVARFSSPDGGFNAIEPGKLVPMLLACAICIAGYGSAVIIGQKTAVMMGEIESAWISRATAIAGFFALTATEPRREPVRNWAWAGLAAMGVLDATGLIAVNASGHYPGKEFAAIGISGYGAIAVILAAVVLKEKVTPPQWFGIALITVGLIVLGLPQ